MFRSSTPSPSPRRSGHRRRARLVSPALILGLLATVLFTVLPSSSAQATPLRNTSAWSVILCKFSDQSAEPQTPTFFSRFFGPAGAGQQGLYDYFKATSFQKVLLSADVRGWYPMAYSLAAEAPKDRGTKIQDCVNTAAQYGYLVPAGNQVAVITNAAQDSGSAGGRVILDPGAWNIRFAAHEMGHAYGLNHSFSNDLTYQNAPWSQPGEYDDLWDEMSAQHVYGYETPYFGNSGVTFNAYQRDKLGWLPKDRVVTFGANGVSSASMTLSSLQSPTIPGTLLLRVPFDPADLFHYYTVEFNRKLAWQKGIPADIVLIHEVQNGIPTLIRNLGAPGKPPAQSLNANGVSISLNWVDGGQVSVAVSSQIVGRCVQGYVWREARSTDYVCVTGATRSQVAYDNSVKTSRWVNGPFGPHTCISGYVWREAFSGDDVCVTGAQRTLAAQDNAAAASRANPARLVYGPNTCTLGYVWRDGDKSDYVCVTGATRSQVAADNAVKTSRWVSGPYGPHTCVSGYVWREAWTGDDVCVTGSQRSQARADNLAAAGRVLRPVG
ncbi:MAG: reprolysin-like metallopeptidase [Lapillicoccus sp.]